MKLFLTLIIPMVVAWGGITLLLYGKVLKGVIDHPNERSLHALPVPRTGGIALMTGLLIGWAAAWQPWMAPMVVCVFLLMTLSFIDDMKGLAASVRFLVHLLGGSVFVWYVALPGTSLLLVAVIVFGIVWMTNLYNFMDGSDGLAGGMAVFGFGAYGIAAAIAGDMPFSTACLTVVMSALAFLKFNFSPARIFMGDSGSIPLGFLSGALGFMGWQRDLWPLWFPLMAFSPFVVDATVTLFRRLLRGEKVWQAHREHFYQKLVRIGWGHRRTALAEYGLMAAVGLSSVLMLNQPGILQAAFGLGWLLAYLLAMKNIDRMWSDSLHAQS